MHHQLCREATSIRNHSPCFIDVWLAENGWQIYTFDFWELNDLQLLTFDFCLVTFDFWRLATFAKRNPPSLSSFLLQAPPPPIHRSHDSISAAVCVKENNLRVKENNVQMKENNVRMNENNDCMKESSSMQQMRATPPQVAKIFNYASSSKSFANFPFSHPITDHFPLQGAPDGPLPPCPTSSPSLGAQEVNNVKTTNQWTNTDFLFLWKYEIRYEKV